MIVDPPSFAPSKATVDRARASYERIFALAAQVSEPLVRVAAGLRPTHTLRVPQTCVFGPRAHFGRCLRYGKGLVLFGTKRRLMQLYSNSPS